MLFNSFLFIFGFLPIALLIFYQLGKRSRTWASVALTLLSLAFYAHWHWQQMWVLLFSIAFNYIVGRRIQLAHANNATQLVNRLLAMGLIIDLAILGYFKYSNFLLANLGSMFGEHWTLGHIALPLGISFFTFQKIAFLMDSARGEAKGTRFIDFSLFAAFFPQLISGPIVHYSEVIPQFGKRLFGHLQMRNILFGLAIFTIGLFKKTVIADTLAEYLTPLYKATQAAHSVDLRSGWLVAISFTFQVYFDFSGYSDMAIGLARMFGVLLPLNFHSPLKAANITDYWRRWHMTLQRFIMSYVFQPLALPCNRLVIERGLQGWPAFFVATALPTFVTFFVVGIWHGAGWTFVIFGLMQGVYTCTNEIWRERQRRERRRRRKLGLAMPVSTVFDKIWAHALTLTCVLFANTMFRADTVHQGVALWRGMLGLNGWQHMKALDALMPPALWLTLIFCTLLIALFPNTQQLMQRYRPAVNWSDWRTQGLPIIAWRWRPHLAGLAAIGTLLFFGIELIQRGRAVFLYFNF